MVSSLIAVAPAPGARAGWQDFASFRIDAAARRDEYLRVRDPVR